MAAPARRETTDEAFLREQYGEIDTYTKPVNRNGFGVRNAQIERRRGATTPPANQPRPPLRVVSQPQNTRPSSQYSERQTNIPHVTRRAERPTTVPRVERTKKNKGLLKNTKEIVRTGFAYARAVPVVISALTWTSYAYIVQLIFGVIALLFLGIAAYLESVINEYETSFIITTAIQAVIAATGIDLEVILTIYAVATIVVIVTILIMLFLSLIQLKLAMLHPLFGKRGVTMKLGTFLLALVGMFIPGINLLPLVQFWLVAVVLNPR